MSVPENVLAANRSVGVRVQQLGFALLAVVVLLAAISWLTARGTSGEVHLYADQDVPSVELLLNADRDAYQARAALLQATLAGPDEVPDLVASVDENAQQVADRFAQYVELSQGREGEDAAQATFQVAFADWRATVDGIASAPAGRTEEVFAADASFEEFRGALDTIQQIYEPVVAGFAEELDASSDRDTLVTGLLTLVAVGLGAAFTLATARRIRRMLDESAHENAATTARIVEAGERTALVTTDLVSASDGLAGLSGELLGTATQAAERAGQASDSASRVDDSVSSVAAAMEEMTATVREISENVAQASQVTAEAVERARATTATVSALGDSSKEIGAVTDVIATIAEQTNLLALNATIEAARAGEDGKGFAVVANEVKELAQQTAEATTNISQKVAAIQTTTVESADAIEQISLVIDRVAELQQLIAAAVEEQAATTNEISASLQSAAGGAGEISEAVQSVASIAGDTTQRAQAVRETANQLGELAERLREIQAGGAAGAATAPAHGEEVAPAGEAPTQTSTSLRERVLARS